MNCEKCNVRDFVHCDLYCRGCPDKPKPKIITGIAYLYLKSSSNPVSSVVVEAPVGMEDEVSVVELMQDYRFEFIESGREALTETIFKEMRK